MSKSIRLNEPIDVDLFLNIWKQELEEMPHKAFSDNMKHLKVENKTYANWIKTWLAWNELSCDEDINMYYGGDAASYIEYDEEIE